MANWKHQQRENIWHVFDRGVRQSPIFFTDEQRLLFLRLLRWAADQTSIQVICFCLMDNHYHLLLRGLGDALSKCMLLLNSRFARAVNCQLETSGRLFQTGFKSYRAKNEAWLIDRATYIHLNPVAAGIVDDPADYRWSSFPAFLGRPSEMDTIEPDLILRLAGGRERYRELVNHSAAAISTRREEDGLVKNAHVGPESPCLEEVTVLMEESRNLNKIVVDTLISEVDSSRKRAVLTRKLTSHLSKEWNIGSTATTAAVLVCSERTVRHHRKSVAAYLKYHPDLLSLCDRVRDSFFTSIMS